MKKKYYSFLAVILLALSGCSNNSSSTSSPSTPIPSTPTPGEQLGVGSGLTKESPLFLGDPGSDKLEVNFIEMHHLYGDALLLKMGNVDVLIDAGQAADGPYVKKFLEKNVTDKRLDLIVATHAHGDHIGGMEEALPVIDNASLIVDFGNKLNGNNDGYQGYRTQRERLRSSGAKYCSAYDSVNDVQPTVCASKYYLTADFTVEIIKSSYYQKPESESNVDANSTSVATLFQYKDFTFYTAGDMPTNPELSLVNKGLLREVTLFKASHHGTEGGNTTELLNVLKPKMVGISASRAGRYTQDGQVSDPKSTLNLTGASGHPHTDAVKRIFASKYIKENHNVYWNMVNGNMKFITDGSKDLPTFQGSPTEHGYYLPETVAKPLVWNETLGRYDGKIEGEENTKMCDAAIWKIRGFDPLV